MKDNTKPLAVTTTCTLKTLRTIRIRALESDSLRKENDDLYKDRVRRPDDAGSSKTRTEVNRYSDISTLLAFFRNELDRMNDSLIQNEALVHKGNIPAADVKMRMSCDERSGSVLMLALFAI